MTAFLPEDVFDISRKEIAVASLIARDMYNKKSISEEDLGRLLTAVSRLRGIADAAYSHKLHMVDDQ